jgi:hypothetical protein
VVDVDVPAEGVADERQHRRVVDEVDEGIVQAEEREPVQRVAVRRLRAPDALDRGGQPLDGVRFDTCRLRLRVRLNRPVERTA